MNDNREPNRVLLTGGYAEQCRCCGAPLLTDEEDRGTCDDCEYIVAGVVFCNLMLNGRGSEADWPIRDLATEWGVGK